MSGRLISANTSSTGHRMRALVAAIAVQRRLAVRPDESLGLMPTWRVILGQQDVGELDSPPPVSGPAAGPDSFAGAGPAARPAALLPPVGGAALARAAGAAARRRLRRLQRLAQLLDLLQDQLELVLGPPQLASQPGHVGAPRQAQVAQDQIGRRCRSWSARRRSRSSGPAARRSWACETISSNACAVRFSASSYRRWTSSVGLLRRSSAILISPHLSSKQSDWGRERRKPVPAAPALTSSARRERSTRKDCRSPA